MQNFQTPAASRRGFLKALGAMGAAGAFAAGLSACGGGDELTTSTGPTVPETSATERPDHRFRAAVPLPAGVTPGRLRGGRPLRPPAGRLRGEPVRRHRGVDSSRPGHDAPASSASGADAGVQVSRPWAHVQRVAWAAAADQGAERAGARWNDVEGEQVRHPADRAHDDPGPSRYQRRGDRLPQPEGDREAGREKGVARGAVG